MADANCLYQLDKYTEHNSEFLDSFYFDNLDDELSEALDFFTDPTNNNSTLNEQDVQQFVEQNRNKNTVNKTSSSLNVFYKWAKSINENRNIDEIPASDLDNILAHFVIKIRKQNGDEYEPNTLTSFFRSFDRFLRQQGKTYNLMTDRQFARAREALASKCKQLRRQGKGQRPNKALGLSSEQIDKLWSTEQLSNKSPQSLLRTV